MLPGVVEPISLTSRCFLPRLTVLLKANAGNFFSMSSGVSELIYLSSPSFLRCDLSLQ